MEPVKPNGDKDSDRISFPAQGGSGMDRDANIGPLFENLDVGLLSIESVALSLGKAPQTIRNWIAMRQFPSVRIGRKNWVSRDSLLRWLQSKEMPYGRNRTKT